MKKALCPFVFCIIFMLTILVGATDIRGDVSQNGERNLKDMMLILQSIVNRQTLVGADVNRDGKCDIQDAISVAELIVQPPKAEGMNGMTLLEFVSEVHSPKAAGHAAMAEMLCISTAEMKGTHDAQYVFANGKAYIVYEANNEMAGDLETYEKEYAALAIVDIDSFTVENVEKFAYGNQVYANVTLPKGSAFVPRVIRKDENTLRFFFSNIVKDTSAYIYYVDYYLATDTFAENAYRLQIMTSRGEEDFSAEVYAELFRADGHECLDGYMGHYLFDIFDIGNTKYIALNNFHCGQNSLAKFNDTYDCVEIIGNIGGVFDNIKTTESGIVQLKDGTWMAILRNETGDKNYRFSYSKDGKTWSLPRSEDFVKNGTTSKPTLARFGEYYFMGWNEISRSLFHIAYSLDAKTWKTLYSFYAPTTFQYPEFNMHNGQMYFSVTTGSKEQIWFGKLPIYENDGNFYIEETKDNVKAFFDGINDYTSLCSAVQTNSDGTIWDTYVKRDADGIYFYAETDGNFVTDKLFFLLDTTGTATTLSATASPDNLMLRIYGNSIQIQSVYEAGKRGYKPLSSYPDVQFFKIHENSKNKFGVYIPYAAISEIAPFCTKVDANSGLYIAVFGACGNKEYVPALYGQTVVWKNPTTYVVCNPDGSITTK